MRLAGRVRGDEAGHHAGDREDVLEEEQALERLPPSCEIGIFAPKWEVFSRFLAVKHRIGAYDGLLCPHVVPSVR